MSTNLSSTSGIATVVYNSFSNVPSNISGTILDCVDAARSFVSNFCGDAIPTTGIQDQYQSPILDFSMANVVNMFTLDPSTNALSLAELSVGKTDSVLTAQQYSALGEMKLKALGRKIQYAKSLS